MRKVINGVYWLSLGMANVYLVETGGALTLFDAGSPRSAGRILQAIRALAGRSDALSHIVITHGHSDHIGGAAAIQQETGATIWMHPVEAGALTTGEGNRYVAPPNAGLLARLVPGGVRPAPVEGELIDGEALPFAPAWLCYYTPGHTLGQCCFHNEEKGVLITGDAVMRWFGRLSPPFKAASVDVARNRQSLQRLVQLDFEVLLFGHGPPITRDGRRVLETWLARQPMR